ncbi:cobalt-precorrin 5A hydrolase [Halorhabdus rudnickae]|uniref:cobalt-precorrin 5A hydrolase n=1 Tax=Halorhabdus rudnickae TaxID=1775544 RepID=UPI0010847AAC|nr:cobalt-precorrin 5A hydrolase [Halorhabdus rudnickae]
MSGEACVDSVAVVSFEREHSTAEQLAETLRNDRRTVEVSTYDDGVFEQVWDRDGIVALMASGIVVRKIAPLLADKWADPAVVAVDAERTWAIPLVGGHHGANRLAEELASAGPVPTVTTATDAAGQQGVETRAAALGASIETPDSTVATNLAVRDGALGPIERLDGPRAVLVEEDVTVLKRTDAAEVVIGTGCRAGTDAETCRQAWLDTLEATGRDRSDIEFVATGELKADEPGLLEAAASLDLGVVAFEKETLERFDGPSESRARELLDWPGIAEASAIAGGRTHELLAPKRTFEDRVTVAVGR